MQKKTWSDDGKFPRTEQLHGMFAKRHLRRISIRHSTIESNDTRTLRQARIQGLLTAIQEVSNPNPDAQPDPCPQGISNAQTQEPSDSADVKGPSRDDPTHPRDVSQDCRAGLHRRHHQASPLPRERELTRRVPLRFPRKKLGCP